MERGIREACTNPERHFGFGEERGSRTELFSLEYLRRQFLLILIIVLRECHTVDFIGRGS